MLQPEHPSEWKLPRARWSHILERSFTEAQVTWPVVCNHLQGQIIKVEILTLPGNMWFVLFSLGSAWPLSISVGTYGRIEVILQVTQDVCSVSFIRPNWCPHWALSPTSATKHSSHPWMWKCTRMSGQMSYQTGLWDILLFYRAKGLLHCLKCFNMNAERQVEGKHTTNVHL